MQVIPSPSLPAPPWASGRQPSLSDCLNDFERRGCPLLRHAAAQIGLAVRNSECLVSSEGTWTLAGAAPPRQLAAKALSMPPDELTPEHKMRTKLRTFPGAILFLVELECVFPRYPNISTIARSGGVCAAPTPPCQTLACADDVHRLASGLSCQCPAPLHPTPSPSKGVRGGSHPSKSVAPRSSTLFPLPSCATRWAARTSALAVPDSPAGAHLLCVPLAPPPMARHRHPHPALLAQLPRGVLATLHVAQCRPRSLRNAERKECGFSMSFFMW